MEASNKTDRNTELALEQIIAYELASSWLNWVPTFMGLDKFIAKIFIRRVERKLKNYSQMMKLKASMEIGAKGDRNAAEHRT